jgi:hypothetical protein
MFNPAAYLPFLATCITAITPPTHTHPHTHTHARARAHVRTCSEKREEAKRMGKHRYDSADESGSDDGELQLRRPAGKGQRRQLDSDGGVEGGEGGESDEELPAGVEDDPFFQKEDNPFDDPFFQVKGGAQTLLVGDCGEPDQWVVIVGNWISGWPR